MPNRLHYLFLSAVLTALVFQSAFSQPAELENFAIKPGQSVYVVAVKGECGNTISPAAVNGRVLVIPGARMQAGAERKILSYAEPFPQATQVISQAIANSKTFIVVNSPDQADFIFHVCAAYTEDLMPAEAMRRMNIRSQLAFAEARVVPASVYRADHESIFTPLWKAKTPDDKRPVPTYNAKSESKKKKEKTALPPQPQGVVIINGVPMNIAPNNASSDPELEDLTKYFLQDYAKLTAVKIPKLQGTIKPPDHQQSRPVLANKPDDAVGEKSRPALRNQAGEPLIAAQEETPTKPAPETEEVIKVDTALVYVPVRVFDKNGKYVPDLTKKEFNIFEDDAEQEVENFSAVDDPFHVVLLLDMSGSTRFKVEEIQDAALEFIEQLRPQDRVLVASFENAVYIDAEFTNDRAKLTKAILRTHTGGGTRLYDAVDLALSERLNRIQGRKAIVLFSDGVDTTSKRTTLLGNLGKIEESNVLVYPIRYDTMPDLSQMVKINGNSVPAPPQAATRLKETYERATMYMNELATRSGGRSYEAATLTDAKSAFANIAEELRRQYWLSYYSTNPKSDGSYRKIRVVVDQSENQKWAVRAKNGYRAPKK